MTCRELIDFLMEYLAGGLPADQRATFEAHLAECPPCVAYLESYQATVQLSKAACAAPVPSMPEELVKAILASKAEGS